MSTRSCHCKPKTHCNECDDDSSSCSSDSSSSCCTSHHHSHHHSHHSHHGHHSHHSHHDHHSHHSPKHCSPKRRHSPCQTVTGRVPRATFQADVYTVNADPNEYHSRHSRRSRRHH